MPSGIVTVPKVQPKPARRERGVLDHDLARGADTAASAELGRRAGRLVSPDERARLANRLVTLLGDARRSNFGAFRKKTRARHAAIHRSADDLMELVSRLRDGEPITARGAAMAALLVDRKAGPLRRGDGNGLPYVVRAALVALDGPDRDPSDLAQATSAALE
ncbi:MAG TPA: hypothetical protein VFB44_05030 [Thermoleophilaceae bacterium]|nr:hypothetical protein [Thermoleophilaceae bacterium]